MIRAGLVQTSLRCCYYIVMQLQLLVSASIESKSVFNRHHKPIECYDDDGCCDVVRRISISSAFQLPQRRFFSYLHRHTEHIYSKQFMSIIQRAGIIREEAAHHS